MLPIGQTPMRLHERRRGILRRLVSSRAAELPMLSSESSFAQQLGRSRVPRPSWIFATNPRKPIVFNWLIAMILGHSRRHGAKIANAGPIGGVDWRCRVESRRVRHSSGFSAKGIEQ